MILKLWWFDYFKIHINKNTKRKPVKFIIEKSAEKTWKWIEVILDFNMYTKYFT